MVRELSGFRQNLAIRPLGRPILRAAEIHWSHVAIAETGSARRTAIAAPLLPCCWRVSSWSASSVGNRGGCSDRTR